MFGGGLGCHVGALLEQSARIVDRVYRAAHLGTGGTGRDAGA
jgi:hypothetical protein